MSIKGQQQFSIQLLQIFDGVLIWLSFGIADFTRSPIRLLLGMNTSDDGGLSEMMWAVYVMVPLTPLVLEKFGFYKRPISMRKAQRFYRLFQGMLVVGLIIGMMAIFGQMGGARRLVLAFGVIYSFTLIFIRSSCSSRIAKVRAKQDGYKDAVVLAGSEEETSAFLADVDPEVLETWRVVAHFDLEKATIVDLDQLIKRESVSRVIFLAGHAEFDRVSRAVETCEVQGVEAWIGASFLQTQVARPSFDVVGGQPMLVFRSTPELSWQLFAKKVMDITGAVVVLLLTMPIWIFVAIMIRVKSPGAPVLFTQQRSGLYGKPFCIYKFRTMVPNAEALLDEVKEEHGNEVDGPAFKLKTDPRIFPFGHFLRKYSIDELPQLVNVIFGDMSLVGPRLLPLHEIDAIVNSAHRRRLSMKPGITCLWQIGGRSDITDFDQWVKLDVAYIDKWSIWEDVKILFKTIPAVLFSKGAR